jgi:ATP-dependent protease ClpP protease subunit
MITEGRQLVGIETEGFAILDTMSYIKVRVPRPLAR